MSSIILSEIPNFGRKPNRQRETLRIACDRTPWHSHFNRREAILRVLVPVRAGPVHTHLRAPRFLSSNSDGSFSCALQRCCGVRTVSPAGYVTNGCPDLFSPPPCRSAIKFATRYLTRVRVAVSPASLFCLGGLWFCVFVPPPRASRFLCRRTPACHPWALPPAPPSGTLHPQPSDRPTSTYTNENHGVHPTVKRQSASNFGFFLNVAMARRTRKAVLSTLRKRLLIFSVLLAAMEVGAIDKGDLIPGGGRLSKLCLHLCCGLSWKALQQMHTQRYLQRERGGVPKTDAWFKWEFYSASEKQFRTAFRVNRSKASFWCARAPLSVAAGVGGQPSLDLQLAVTLFRVGHYGNACSVYAVSDLFAVPVGGVIKSTRRVVNALTGVAPQHIRWQNTQRRAGLSMYAAETFGFAGCIGATDGATFLLAYQPALHPWAYYDRKQRYSLNGLITCDWDCRITNCVLGCTGAAPDTYVQSTAAWHRRPNVYFTNGQYLLGDMGMLYSRHVIGPFKEPECTFAEHRNYDHQLARLQVKSEHAIGILKGRWGSLKELRLTLATDRQFSFSTTWITACILIHNICVDEGEDFPIPPVPEFSPASAVELFVEARLRRLRISARVCAFMREKKV